MPSSSHPRWTASQLRRDLTARAAHHARTHSMLHDISPGPDPALLFGRDEHARHGNFHPAAYAAICANPDWLRRLSKPHTASRRSLARKDWRWMELDSASSSDALLMNIFCHPEVFSDTRLAAPVAALLNVDPTASPCFGARPGVPLNTALKPRTKKSPPREAVDRTEIDLTLASPASTLFLEAKLTESGFQTAAPSLLTRYRDLEAVFDIDRLPRKILTPPPLPPNLDPDDPTINLPTPRQPHPHRQLPTHPQRPRRLRRGRLLLHSPRRPPPRPHRELVRRPLRGSLAHLRHTPQAAHLAGTRRYTPQRTSEFPRRQVRHRALISPRKWLFAGAIYATTCTSTQ